MRESVGLTLGGCERGVWALRERVEMEKREDVVGMKGRIKTWNDVACGWGRENEKG